MAASRRRVDEWRRDAERQVLVLDGGLATELEKHPEVDLDTSCLWSARLLLEDHAHLQHVVVDAHAAYYDAGADVATTVSYQASRDGFEQETPGTTAQQVQRYLQRSVELAVEARDRVWQQWQRQPSVPPRPVPLVAASIGCYGAALADGSEYRGEYGKSKSELMAWHRERMACLAATPGVDFLICETVPCIVEVEALLSLLPEFPTARIMLAVACRNERELNSGEPIAALTPLLKQVQDRTQLLAVGVNCTAPWHVLGLSNAFECPCPKLVYPNSGEGWCGVTKTWLPPNQASGPSTWDSYLQQWYAAGARVFGGCCRTTPEDIQAIRAFFTGTTSPTKTREQEKR
ncbi:TPA: hypothetical protein N0F65_009881 [Lagenidium giganteum]|uniref:Hcy-binding domain-containing protein n=1 Tax=Lagenidium giganteum TaxID=4803 RepID=A0AAV2YR66_9STRA|nr:TPA: hypothetical protein N0F65_009881 [Lagenidium giganteum]